MDFQSNMVEDKPTDVGIEVDASEHLPLKYVHARPIISGGLC